MSSELAVDLCREAMYVALLVAGPVLLIALIVGLVIGLLQALTQIQDQTVAFVPKLLAMGVALAFVLPWMLQRLIEYSQTLWTNIPRLVAGG
jgi:flagellar biosynthetic protein FliQ